MQKHYLIFSCNFNIFILYQTVFISQKTWEWSLPKTAYLANDSYLKKVKGRNNMGKLNLVETLNQVIEITSIEDLNLESFKEKLVELNQRLQEGRFHLAVLGQFKRGKSTLVNSLLGAKLMPTAVLPLTAIPTFIYYNPSLFAKVCFLAKMSKEEIFKGDIDELKNFLDKYVTESGNPENKLGVSHVEIHYPSDLLKKGFVLIDTPGIGSTYKHNTEMTINFLPQCDAALFVTSSDPPITEVELDFLKSIFSSVPKIFFVLNKIDYLDEDELETSINFLKKVIKKELNLTNDIEVFPISAKKAINGKLKDNNILLKESNISFLENNILEFMEKEKGEALKKAISIKAKDIIENILMQLKILIKSYQSPLEELEEKIKILEQEIEKAKEQKIYVGDILKGDMKRVEQFLDNEADKLKEKAFNYFQKEIVEICNSNEPAEIKIKVDEYIKKSIPPYFEREFGIFSRNFNKKASEILGAHEDKAMEVIETIRKNAMKLMDIPYIPLQGDKGLKMRIKPYWVVNRWDTTLTAISNTVVDTLMPKNILKKKLLKRYIDKLDMLLNSNIENLRWSIFQGIQDTFREFNFDFDRQMEEVINATKGAVEKAIYKRQNQAGKIDEEIEKLNNVIEKLESMKNLL